MSSLSRVIYFPLPLDTGCIRSGYGWMISTLTQRKSGQLPAAEKVLECAWPTAETIELFFPFSLLYFTDSPRQLLITAGSGWKAWKSIVGKENQKMQAFRATSNLWAVWKSGPLDMVEVVVTSAWHDTEATHTGCVCDRCDRTKTKTFFVQWISICSSWIRAVRDLILFSVIKHRKC